MASEYKRFRDYEMMVIFHPELSEEDVASESDRVQEYLTGAAATVTHVNRDAPWGRRRLAYPIRHGSRDLRDGIYALYYFHAESGRVEDIEREVKLNDRIIRYLLTQQIAPIAEPEPPEGEEGDEAPADGETEAEAPVATRAAGAPAETTEAAEASDSEAAPAPADAVVAEEPTEAAEDSESEPSES